MFRKTAFLRSVPFFPLSASIADLIPIFLIQLNILKVQTMMVSKSP